MKFKPPGHRLMVLPDKLEEVQALEKKHETLSKIGLVIHKPEGQLRRDAQGCDSGTIVAIGPMAWKHKDMGYGDPDWAPWAKVGDKIIFGKYAGKLIPDPEDESVEYMVINDDDVQLVGE